jgi:PAS domain S-box-containing protein
MPAMETASSSAPGFAATWAPWAWIRPAALRRVLGFLLFLAAYFIAYWFSTRFSLQMSAPFWFPVSVLLCALLCVRTSWWWLLLVSTLPIRIVANSQPDAGMWVVLACFSIDCLQASVSAWILRRFQPDPLRLESMRDLGVFMGVVVLLTTVLSAFGGAWIWSSLGNPFWPSWERWLLGNAMTSLIVTPILFYWVMRPPNPATFSLPRIIEAGLLTVGLVVSLSLAFSPGTAPADFTDLPHYAPMPFIVWAAIRFRMHGATGAVALLTVLAVNSALDGTGSFTGQSAAETSTNLQHFLLLRVAPLYLAAVLIEQWHRTDSSLRESEQRFRDMADCAPVMIWMSDVTGSCVFVNRPWEDFTGWNVDRLLDRGWQDLIHPEDRPRAVNRYAEQAGAPRSFDDELRIRRHDGEYRWIYVRGLPRHASCGQFVGYVGSALDVTERREQQVELMRSEARYRDVVESQTAFVCRFLPDGTLTFVNAAYCRVIGQPREQMLGRKLLDLQPPVARQPVRDGIARVIGGAESAEWECEFTRADGGRGWQHWVCHAIGGVADESREMQAIGQDITDRKRAEESGRQLVQATRFAAVGELTAMVAHEINQPLCAILNNAEAAEILLKSDQPPLGEVREILADIRRDDLRADSAIRNIRSLLQRQEFRPRPLELNDLVGDVLKLVAGDALYRRVRARSDLAHRLPRMIGDPSQLKQVLVILIVNGMDAMKDTPEEQRELRVITRQVDEAEIEVRVLDRGHGIAPENMSQLFESFFTTKSDGMGLGLAIARSMIAVHGGRIRAENAAGGGAMFCVTLPVRTGSEAA